MEKRGYTRVEAAELASVIHADEHFVGLVENVSLQGFFVKTRHALPLHATVDVTVYATADSMIHADAAVVRCESTGLGMQIKNMDLQSFISLCKLLERQNPDADRLALESQKMMNYMQN